MSEHLKLQRMQVLDRKAELLCLAGGLVTRPGYVGQIPCNQDHMKVYKLHEQWQARFPDPRRSCGGGNAMKDPRCGYMAPGASHPGVVMKSDYLYELEIDIP